MATAGASVIANDQRTGRVRLVRENALTLGIEVPVVVADGTAPPYRDGAFDAVLLDAPCSGLGALRRRADARWRIRASDVAELAELQQRLLLAAAPLVAVGGRLVYSVCTITAAESVDHDTPDGFEVEPAPPPIGTWRPFRQGWRVLPHDADTDGMVMIRYRRIL
jgi:16S rRNA (cytosine967-C5)-methyltransferase